MGQSIPVSQGSPMGQNIPMSALESPILAACLKLPMGAPESLPSALGVALVTMTLAKWRWSTLGNLSTSRPGRRWHSHCRPGRSSFAHI